MCKNLSSFKKQLAIVGMGCRFPGGASDPAKFWDLLINKKDLMSDIPRGRWDYRQFYDENPDKSGKAYNFQGGFLKENVELFDPLFFGISPREARVMDPQQRLLLEVVWEAFEDAGLTKERLDGSSTGVFIGGFWLDHQTNQFDSLNINIANVHSPMSATLTLLSNRISYVFNLKGPSLTIDTACSSSLVAAHYACQSIWNNDCEAAIIGGANIMTSCSNSIGLSKGKFLSKDSRCMTFDARANGYARGEGAAVILVMPLEKAQHENLPVYALIKNTGVNQDGQTPGLTLPNPDAQVALIRKVYQEAGIKPGQVQYIEAHGTGTRAGDVAESSVLQEVFNENGTRQDKIYAGSVKTNMGHLEAAAGMAGLIKATLCLKHEQIPPNLHFKNPNPAIPFEKMCIQVPTETVPWPSSSASKYAGVNGFGYGGTNGHILLESAGRPASEPSAIKGSNEDDTGKKLSLLPLSGQCTQAVKDLAGRYQDYLTNNPAGREISFRDLAKTLCTKRSHLDIRAFVIAEDKELYLQKLTDISQAANQTFHPVSSEQDRKIVFVYTGMGPQWWAMGRELYGRETVFKQTIDHLDEVFASISGWSIKAELLADEDKSRMSETGIAQPANFLLQIALTELWASWGIKPQAIIGHSVGEVAAACAAGVLTIEQSLLVSYHRSRLQQSLAGQGGSMLAVNLTEKAALELFIELNLTLSIGAVNSSTSVTVSGNLADLQVLSEHLKAKDIFNRFLQVEVAYHSQQMDPIKDEFQQALKKLKPVPAKVALYSTVTGTRMVGTELDAHYWWQNVRQPVYLQKGVSSLISDGYYHFLEVGPHPVLGQSIQLELMEQKQEGHLLYSLKRKEPEEMTMLTTLGNLYQLGYDVNWPALVDAEAAFVKLPHYPWQQERYWYESEQLHNYRFGQPGHVLLNRKHFVPNPTWEVELNPYFLPFIKDHCVGSSVVIPGALYVEAALAVHDKLFSEQPWCVENIRFHQLLSLQPGKAQRLLTQYHQPTNHVEIYSAVKEEEATWTHHATIGLKRVKDGLTPPVWDLSAIRERCDEQVDVTEFYEMLTQRNLHYGSYFRPITQIGRGEQEVLITIAPEKLPAVDDGYLLGPTILDALFQSLIVVPKQSQNGNGQESKTYIPVAIEQLQLFSKPVMPCYGWATVLWKNEKALKGNAVLFNADGQVIGEIRGIICQHLAQGEQSDTQVGAECFYELNWQVEELAVSSESAKAARWLMIDLGSDLSVTLRETLKAQDIDTYLVRYTEEEESRIDEREALIKQRDPAALAAIKEKWRAEQVTQLVFIADSLGTNDSDTLYEHIVDACQKVIDWLQNYLTHGINKKIGLSFISKGLHGPEENSNLSFLASAPLWGLARVIRNEFPTLTCRLIDMSVDLEPDTLFKKLVIELLQDTTNEEILLKADKRLVHRLKNHPLEQVATEKESIMISAEEPVSLAGDIRGALTETAPVCFTEYKRQPPEEKEVEINVDLIALQSPKGSLLSESISEFTGTIVRTGADVNGLNVGDKVMGIYPSALANYINIPAQYVYPLTGFISDSALPLSLASLGAYYGLIECVGLKKDEHLLINGIMNETGRAALVLARAFGARVSVVCDTDEEKNYCTGQGVAGISLTSLAEPLAVDTIFNINSNEIKMCLIDQLKPGARFIQVVDHEQHQNPSISLPVTRLGMVHLLNLKWIWQEHPAQLRQIADSFISSGCVSQVKLPVKTFSLSQLEEAIQQLAVADNVQRILVTMTGKVPVPKKGATIVHAQGSYLITGGTGGFGLEVAKWMGENGAGELILVSRKGDKNPEVKEAVARMRKQGQKVTVLAADITDCNACREIIQTIKTTMLPLKGIVHSAMVLDDCYLDTITAEQLEKVLAPKIKGVLNIDEATADLKLDFFVMFSSISSLIGNLGQANYSAANAFLDSFAHYRRRKGQPATTINWGALAETGVVARNQQVAKLLEQAGIKGLTNNQAIQAFQRAIELDATQLGVFDVDWPTWLEQSQGNGRWPLFEKLVRSLTLKNEQILALVQELQQNSEEQHLTIIEEKIAGTISQVINLPVENIERNMNIMNYGVDSLMAIELARHLKGELGLELSIIEFMNGPSVAQLGRLLMEQLTPYFEEEQLAGIDDLSEKELDALLTRELTDQISQS